ncbi:MAG: SAM-dependent methyltransferase [Lachnospiraceae bacterium]|nr:SAM-dependent methyltransferase [Lachnospiraceae bacterium]
MDTNLEQVLAAVMTEQLVEGVISNPSKSQEVTKIKFRLIQIKGKLQVQITKYKGKQVFHENKSLEEAKMEAVSWFDKEKYGMKQGQITTQEQEVSILVSKKGKVTIKQKQRKNEIPFRLDLSHNRKKHYILEEGTRVPFLVDLGVMTQEGKIVRTRYDKFKQINRFLEFIEDILPYLAKDREVTILDFGCGKSYLTFAMYYYLHELKSYNVRIIGLDLKKDVIAHCNQLKDKYGYEKLQFLEGNVADYDGVEQVDMVVTLHACNTATDYALYKAIKWNASVILSVPCCQHELNQNMQMPELAPLFQYGIIQERCAALFTDAHRANLLEASGYQTQILEFIDMEHTPKNLMIRGVKKSNAKAEEKAWQNCLAMSQFMGTKLTLQTLLEEEKEKRKRS